jgi:hypothetical protein
VPLQEAMHFGLPVIAYDAGAVRETLRGGGLLLQDKRPEMVAELLDRLTRGGDLRRAVLASQADAIAGIRSTDFGALLRERLKPVLGSPDPRETRVALGNDLSRPALSSDASGAASAPRQGPGEGLFRSTVGPGEAAIPTSPVGPSEEGSAVEGREETGGTALKGALRNGQLPRDPACRGSLG